MWNNSNSIAFANIWSYVRLKPPPPNSPSPPQIPSFLPTQIVDIGYENDSFSFYPSIPVLLDFYILLPLITELGLGLGLWLCPQNIINISRTRQHYHQHMLSKIPRSVTHFVWQTFFHWISRVCQIKKILNIYTMILDSMNL